MVKSSVTGQTRGGHIEQRITEEMLAEDDHVGEKEREQDGNRASFYNSVQMNRRVSSRSIWHMELAAKDGFTAIRSPEEGTIWYSLARSVNIISLTNPSSLRSLEENVS